MRVNTNKRLLFTRPAGLYQRVGHGAVAARQMGVAIETDLVDAWSHKIDKRWTTTEAAHVRAKTNVERIRR